MKTHWIKCSDKLPNEEQRVLAHHSGVYEYRLVNFWTDDGGTPHFGWHTEKDGKGSQPATHWHPLPELPK